MHRTLKRILLTVCFLICSSGVLAQQNEGSDPDKPAGETSEPGADVNREPIPDDAELGFMRRSIIVVDDAQRVASERFGSFMGQVDGFFSNAGSNDDAVSNDSWARIRIDGVRANGEDFEIDPSFKLRAVLPRTERKLKLLISTEEDDSGEIGDVQTVTTAGNQNASLALRFIRTARDNGDVNLDIGVRQRDGDVQYFGRLNTRFSLELDENWATNAANSYYHYSKSGYENKLSFDFRRLLYSKDNVYFRTYTDFYWEKGQKGSRIGHTSGFYWLLSKRRSVALEGLASYYTALNEGIDDRFRGHEVRIRWRHNVWRPWLFYEVWPSVSWPSATRYRQTEGILLRVEVIIGKVR